MFEKTRELKLEINDLKDKLKFSEEKKESLLRELEDFKRKQNIKIEDLNRTNRLEKEDLEIELNRKISELEEKLKSKNDEAIRELKDKLRDVEIEKVKAISNLEVYQKVVEAMGFDVKDISTMMNKLIDSLGEAAKSQKVSITNN